MCVEAVFCDGATDYMPVYICGGLLAVEWMFYIISTTALKRVGFELESLCLFLTGIGVMLLARQYDGIKLAATQLVAAVAGMILFCIIIKFIEDPDRVDKWRLIIMIASTGLLAINLISAELQTDLLTGFT